MMNSGWKCSNVVSNCIQLFTTAGFTQHCKPIRLDAAHIGCYAAIRKTDLNVNCQWHVLGNLLTRTSRMCRVLTDDGMKNE